MRVGQLRGNVSSAPITAVGQSRLLTPLVEIKVKGNTPDYVNDKVDVLNDQIEAPGYAPLEHHSTRMSPKS